MFLPPSINLAGESGLIRIATFFFAKVENAWPNVTRVFDFCGARSPEATLPQDMKYLTAGKVGAGQVHQVMCQLKSGVDLERPREGNRFGRYGE
jgi:hypothetical protein